jgi:hypothetical protein
MYFLYFYSNHKIGETREKTLALFFDDGAGESTKINKYK